jgi:hypothetical protein
MRPFAVATALLLSLAPCIAPAQTPWTAGIGVGLSTVSHPSGFPDDEALRDQGSVVTFTGALRRQVAGPLRLGFRASYLRIGTSSTYYCRLTCVVVATASKIHMFPLTPTLEAEWRVEGGHSLFIGVGFGPSVLIREADRSDPTALFEPHHTDVKTAVIAFAGVRPAASRPRVSLEVGLRRLADVNIWSDVHRTRISGFEFALHLVLGK